MDEFDQTLEQPDWKTRLTAYQDRVRPWVEDRQRRLSHQTKHPVYDFLFEYYSFRPSYLLRWSPGVAVRLDGAKQGDLAWSIGYCECDGGLVLPASSFPERRIVALDRAIKHLDAVAGRDVAVSCFGLHEWAMVYRAAVVRHPQVPLRLAADAITDVVETQGLRCTHYDAYRFFTEPAATLNRIALTRSTASEYDQPGCIHANMDLYRFAYNIAPYIPAELIAEAFELAIRARELDMRASPYDLSIFGFEPIPIETRAGREDYVRLQRDLATSACLSRSQVRAAYVRLRDLIQETKKPSGDKCHPRV